MAAIGGRKSVIGLFVDGLDVKLARVSKKGKRLVVDELRSATLVAKLEERKMVEVAGNLIDEKDPFALPDVQASEPAVMSGSEDNNAVLLGLLSQYKPKSYSLAYCVSEPSIYYHPVESDFGLKGKKLKTRLIEELKNVRTFQPTPDAIDSIVTDDGNLLCVVREEGLSLLNHLENIKGFLGNRLPTIAGIDSSDIALMNMVKMNYDLQPDEVSVIIYVGVEFTRLIFMRGQHFFQFAPILSEGYDSSNLQNTVYSRLLLEQDNLNIQRISKIILAGESRRIDLKSFLEQLLPDQQVDYLRTPNVDVSRLPAEQHDIISDYAVAIGVAWRFIDTSNKKFYRTNLLPDEIREGQRVFKLSWHGYVLLAAIFGSTLLFTKGIQEKLHDISEQQSMLDVKHSQIGENTALSNSISAMQEQLMRYNASMALYDSLVPGADKFSKAFSQLSSGVEDMNSIWISEFIAQETGQATLNGFAVNRSRIPRMSALFDNSQLKEVTTEEIRGETVYRYKIEVPSIIKQN
ncbi:MAG: PilN domain-containing protein [Ignavibacteriae bacterium]|nr:PilN domain-containing protein [Ignavibacteriota bacterium]